MRYATRLNSFVLMPIGRIRSNHMSFVGLTFAEKTFSLAVAQPLKKKIGSDLIRSFRPDRNRAGVLLATADQILQT
jgi:hypothetical protein